MTANVSDFTFLQGVKIVDFTQFEAGPSCTEALAWMGADVVKIENPKMGDPGRRLRPGQPDDDPYYFHAFNANKQSITLNLKSPKGLELVKGLIQQADVMIENFAPGAIERLGLSYDVVKALNPGIIYAQVKGFGEGSPFEQNLAFDMIAQACGGTFSVTGDKNGPPIRPGILKGGGTGWTMVCMIPRCSNVTAWLSSSVSSTAPAGIPASPISFMASSLVCVRVQVEMTSSTSASRATRSAGVR